MSRQSTNHLVNYGLVFPEVTSDHYVLGGVLSTLPKIIINEKGDWTDYLPVYEPQFGDGWDTYGCTVWGTENAIETLLKLLTDKESNFSERFNYILAEVRAPGADPHKIAECVREHGLIDQALLPMTDTYEEFLTPDPMEAKYLVEGQKFPYELKHEWLWTPGNSTKLANKKSLIKEMLKYSPVCVSVTAWFEENGVYVDRGYDNTHWCVAYKVDDQDRIHVFDSYDQSKKILHPDHNIYMAKRYYLQTKTKKNWLYTIPLLKQALSLAQTLLDLLRKKS